MQEVKIEKITLNVGAGKDQSKLEKGINLIKNLVGKDAVKTTTKKRIPGWGLRPGLPIGCKLTLRDDTEKLLKKFLYAIDFVLNENNFDEKGNIAFGIPEYIDIEGAEYDPKIGVMGLQVCITLKKPGYRIKKRDKKSKIGKKHIITKEQAIQFMKDKFNIKIGEEE